MEEELNSSEELLCRLGLEKKYLNKLTTAQFLEISRTTVQSEEPSKENELVHVFMQRLLSGDYTARHISVKNKPNIPDSETRVTEDVFTALFKKQTENTERKEADIHPMDVQMAVFLCADDFLRQNIVTKLAQCQYAIPLLVPDPFSEEIVFPVWTMRHIDKTWNSTDASGKIISKPLYKAETPMVAFFRFGSISSSKSQLINDLIHEKHNTCFHRHCPGSSRNRLLMNGVVEIAWYCPSGKPSDYFTECVAFCNLHGDSSRAETQREILTAMASVNVIFLPKLDKNDNNLIIVKELCLSQTPLVVIDTDEEDSHEDTVCMIDRGKYKVKMKRINQSSVSVLLRDVIKKCLSQNRLLFNLEKMTINPKLSVDENNHMCQTGKEAAQRIMNFLKGKDPLTVKETCLPLQGELWYDWCQMSKGLRQLQSKNIELELSNKKTEMKNIRQKQKSHGTGELMRSFINGLKSLSVPERNYFLRWTELLLNEFTSEKLANLQHDYQQKWTEVLDLKNKLNRTEGQGNLDKLKVEQSNIVKISKALNAASFGLEHFIREMCQIYEASVYEEKNMTCQQSETSTLLPNLAAQLMISGHPMELMDGDAAYVPLIWVSAVLNEVIKILGDKRVFVLSVLGLQSSGKSTMLNAMFGLQFAVSAGRCTRGAFMQLLRLSDDMKEELKFDFLLVVDTEGLRSPGESGYNIQHDNALSTFVVGLGNMTLINIFGENLTEIQDILQIVVHALLRMKKVRLNPRCMFVHQNVCDISAKEKLMEGRRHLLETLDKMTKLAAKDEDYCAENFTDIIAFDVESDVKYFAQLWEGSPPMAPPNPYYSQNIQELKKDILSHASNTTGLKLSQFKNRVRDLWTALLKENFVFSFRNAQEISVYRKLEQEYGKWTWSLRSAMLTVEDKMLNRAASDKVETVKKQDLIKEMTGTLDKVKHNLNQYFKEDSEKEILSQWKHKFETQIQDLHDDLIKETKTKVDDCIQQKRIRLSLDKQRVEYEKTLFEKSKELALKLKGNVNNKTHANEEFDFMWGKWVSELSEQAPKFNNVNISNDITEVLGEVYKHDLVINRKRSSEYKIIGNLSDYKSYVHKKKKNMMDKMKNAFHYVCYGMFLPPEMNNSIHDLINEVTKQTKEKVKSFPFSAQGYNSHYIQSIAHEVKTQVQTFEVQFKKDQKVSDDALVFIQDFYVDLTLYECDQSTERITELHRKFQEANDPLIYFEKKRSEYFNIFHKYYEGATSAAILGDQVCSKLDEAILQSVYNMIASFVCGQMREKPPFNGNRADLEKHILKSLAEQMGQKDEKFKVYLIYMYQPRVHFENFIKAKVKEFMSTENPRAVCAIEDHIDHKQTNIMISAKMATDEVRQANGDVNKWLEIFSNSLTDELGDTRVHLCDEEYKDSIDYDILMDVIREKVSVVLEEIKRNLSKMSDFTMETFRERPDEILIKHFCGCCWEQCPFCGSVCTNSQKDHPGDHNADFHRCSGMNGWHYRGTTEFFTDFCTTAVASDKCFYPSSESVIPIPYKQYRTAGGKYDKWGISTDLSELHYWKWFVCEFQQNLEKHHGKQFCGIGEIPAQWKNFTKFDAVNSLGIHSSI